MTMDFKYHIIKYVIYIVTLCGENIQIWKNKIKTPEKYGWEIPAVISLMPIVGDNNCLPILNLSKIMVHIYITGKTIHQFEIGYMINTSLQFNKIFKTQVEKCLGVSFYIRIIKTFKGCLMKKNTSIMALIMIYENNGEMAK